MSITPIIRPLPGERVVAIAPEDAAAAAVTWLRRPNLFPGRALTAPTLEARSAWTAGRIAQRGQAFTPGVVSGLEVGYTVGEPEEVGARAPVQLSIAAGRGLAASGEDLVLPRPLQADFWSLPVVAPPAVLEGGGFGGGGVLQPRAIGPALGELLTEFPDALPRGGVLVLQSATIDRAEIDPEDPCERGCGDDNVNFEDWRFADAARLLWYAWPEDWRPLPPAGDRQRNRLAYTIFEAERALAADTVLPWEEIGLPLAILGLDADFLPVVHDRSSVVRTGGRARYSRLQLGEVGVGGQALSTSVRLPALWQAQVEQFAEQIADLGEPAPAPDVAARGFDRLPPFGLVPRNAVDLAARSSDFFPAAFDLDAVPVPMEQLDVALRESAGMAPFDLARGERVRVLVPVSQASYEPRLLLEEEIDPEFAATLDRFLVDRGRALAGRQSVRVKSSVLLTALRGEAPPVPDIEDDPYAVEPESLAPWGPPPAAAGHRATLLNGVHEHGFTGATATIVPAAADLLYAWVYLDPDRPPRTLMLEWRTATGAVRRGYWGENLIARGTEGRSTRMRIGDLPALGRWLRLDVPAAVLEFDGSTIVGMGFVLFDGRAAFAATGRVEDGVELPWFDASLPEGADPYGDEDFEFLTANELLAPFEGRHGVEPFDGDAGEVSEGRSIALTDLAEDPRISGLLSDSEQSQLAERGVEGFIAYLESRADRADDLVDYGFLKVQTDIYRVRQLVLGTTDATRLAVSPTLAGIAKAETAVASQESISTFFDKLKAGDAVLAANANTTVNMDLRAATSAATSAATTPATSAATSAATSSTAFLSGSRTMFNTAFTTPVVTLDLPQTLAASTFPTATTERLATATDFVREQSTLTPLITTATYTPVDITNAQPLVGSFNVRTISIAQRLEAPKAQEARDYSTSTRHEAVVGLLRLADHLTEEDGGEVPGLFDAIDVWGLVGDEFVPGGEDPVAAIRRPLADFINPELRAGLVASLLRPPLRPQADEATFFADSTDMADRTVALLRQVEGRVKQYRVAINACEEAGGLIRGDLKTLATRERAWGDVLGEARHDVAVTRALISEEQARLDGINARRAAILDREVRFLAYVRPRAADNLSPAAMRPLDPGLLEAPAPSCLSARGDVPDELTAMLAVVREAPSDWFRLQTGLLNGLDRVDLLLRAVQTAQIRTQIARARPLPMLASTTGIAAAIGAVQVRQKERMSLVRDQSLQLDIARLGTLTWQGVRAEAARIVSLGDLIDGDHGNGRVARNAASFFERFGRITGCLHSGFSGVLPSIRLDWAETLSQFDDTVNLRNLSSLPRWPEIEYADRRRLQGLVDWMFDQLDPRETRAHAMVSDVVRMTLLLASHAPVGRIIAGRLPRPVTARPGLRIPLIAFDPSHLRVGMQALMYRADAIVARAVVEDLGQGEASGRVTYTASASVELDEAVRVQFAPAASVSFASSAGIPFGAG